MKRKHSDGATPVASKKRQSTSGSVDMDLDSSGTGNWKIGFKLNVYTPESPFRG